MGARYGMRLSADPAGSCNTIRSLAFRSILIYKWGVVASQSLLKHKECLCECTYI